VILKTGSGVRQGHWKLSTFDGAHTTSYWRAGLSKAEPKNFAPPQTPSRGRGTGLQKGQIGLIWLSARPNGNHAYV